MHVDPAQKKSLPLIFDRDKSTDTGSWQSKIQFFHRQEMKKQIIGASFLCRSETLLALCG